MMHRVIKPKNQRAKRALEKRAPKLHENPKTAMFIRGGNTSETITQAMTDLYLLKKPEAVMYKRKNPVKLFEDPTSIEFFSQKSDSSLFVLGSHSKKRPHNLVIGRLYDGGILDMMELGVEHYIALSAFKTIKCMVGSKPCLVFSGDLFETDSEYARLKNVLIDLFRCEDVVRLNLTGLDHVITITAVEGKIYFRTYQIQFKKSGSSTPRVELEEMGPSLDLVLRRVRMAAPDLYRLACKTPKQLKPTKKKNVSYDAFGSKLGRVHMEHQDFSKLQTRKLKGLKRTRGENGGEGEDKKLRTEQMEVVNNS